MSSRPCSGPEAGCHRRAVSMVWSPLGLQSRVAARKTPTGMLPRPCWAPRQHLGLGGTVTNVPGQSCSRDSSDSKDEQTPALCSGTAQISNIGLAIKSKYFGCCFVNGWSTHSCQLSCLRPTSHMSTTEIYKPWLCHLYTISSVLWGFLKHGLGWLLFHFKSFTRRSEDITTALTGSVNVCACSGRGS